MKEHPPASSEAKERAQVGKKLGQKDDPGIFDVRDHMDHGPSRARLEERLRKNAGEAFWPGRPPVGSPKHLRVPGHARASPRVARVRKRQLEHNTDDACIELASPGRLQVEQKASNASLPIPRRQKSRQGLPSCDAQPKDRGARRRGVRFLEARWRVIEPWKDELALQSPGTKKDGARAQQVVKVFAAFSFGQARFES